MSTTTQPTGQGSGTGGGTATLTGFISAGVVLISVGSDMVKNGQYEYGTILLIIGVALIVLGVYLFQRGLIPQVVRVAQTARTALTRFVSSISAVLKY
jgi:sulfite exporter TauE/SafE